MKREYDNWIMIRGIIKLPLSLQTSIRSMFLLYNFLYTPTLFLSLPVYLHLPFLPPISTFFLALHPILSPTSQPRLPSIRLLRLNHPCSPQLPYSTRNHVLSLSLSLSLSLTLAMNPCPYYLSIMTIGSFYANDRVHASTLFHLFAKSRGLIGHKVGLWLSKGRTSPYSYIVAIYHFLLLDLAVLFLSILPS